MSAPADDHAGSLLAAGLGQGEADRMAAQLVKIGLALSNTRELGDLLELILLEACNMTGADAGSVYLLEGNALRFETSRNATLSARLGEKAVRAIFKRIELPIDSQSIAGYVALSKEILNLADVYVPDQSAPYRFNPSWDMAHGYRTTSMLTVPMMDQEGQVVGVVQLINATVRGHGGDTVVAFDNHYLPVVAAFASQAAVAIVNAKLHGELRDAWLDSVFRLGVAAEFRDKETSNHIKRVCEYSVLLGARIGLTPAQCSNLRWAAAMHDTGKLGIPDAILHKPGPLTPEERSVMEYHTIIGAQILKGGHNPLLKDSQAVALTHHERWDGRGYPQALAGEAIPQFGRIVALADVFDALTSRRVYKPAMPTDQAVAIVTRERGGHFEPQLADVLLSCLDEALEIQRMHQDTDEDFEKFRNYSLLKIDDVL